MLFDFLHNDVVLKECRAILADTENSVHLVKKISAAMAIASARTVNITIRKNETEFIFNTEASSLRGDCGSYYNLWDIVVADHRKFEELFGKSANYIPEEIVRITYAKKILHKTKKTPVIYYPDKGCGRFMLHHIYQYIPTLLIDIHL